MATGFITRWKGKVAAVYGGIFQNGIASGAAFLNAGAPSNGTGGTFANAAPKGSLLLDVTNATMYQNTNTQASPTWTQITTATGAGTYTGTFDGVIGGNTPAAATITALVTSGINKESVTNTITASITQTRAGGTALTTKYNNVTVVANAADAVTLPALTAGQGVVVFNNGAHSASVFPNGASDTIDGGSGGASVALANTKRCLYFCVATNTILSAQLGAVSA
jgi:hypothetical protein